MKQRIKPGGIVLMLGVLALLITGGWFIFKGDSTANPTANNTDKDSGSNTDAPTYIFSVVTFPGYAGGYLFNDGYHPNENSRFFKEYGFNVDFKVQNNIADSRQSFMSDEVNFIWATIDALPTEALSFVKEGVVTAFQVDWSRGADGAVATEDIKTAADLKGKTIAVAEMTPSHSFLLNVLDAASLTQNDIKIVPTPSAIQAAEMFKSGKVDAAIVWAPDDQGCVDAVPGAHILTSTRTASNIISDIFLVKTSFLNEHREDIENLVEGWMTANAELNQEGSVGNSARTRAAEILFENEPEVYGSVAKAQESLNNVRFTTIGDNMAFFGFDQTYKNATAKDIYSRMSQKYAEIGVIDDGETPSWADVSNNTIVSAVSKRLTSNENRAEGVAKFSEPTEDLKTVTPISTKSITINFPTGSAELTNKAKAIIDRDFGMLAKANGNARIRVAGNTDNTGPRSRNEALSLERAQSAITYLVTRYGFDRNRFVAVGNGPTHAINDGVKGANESYRRTDFELLGN